MNGFTPSTESNSFKQLKERIEKKTAVVSITGLGYVGLPLALEKCRAGFRVLGIDINEEKVKMLKGGKSYLKDIKKEQIRPVIDNNTLEVTTSFEKLHLADVIVICVPTPLTEMREPDLSCVKSTVNEITVRLRKGQLIILESTTYPGTTEEILLPMLQSSGSTVGEDFFLAYSPERVDPANRVFGTRNTPKIVGGVTERCCQLAELFYARTVCNVVPVSSPAAAEMTKLFENAYRAVNIAFVNELMLLCDKMQLDVWEIIDAAGTKPFGIDIFYPGPGFGGHCIPVDPFYLSYRARKYGHLMSFIELAGQMNILASDYVLTRIQRVLNSRHKCLNGAKIFVIGVAYKKDVEDVRESPAIRIISGLLRENADVSYHDPYVPCLNLPGRKESLLSTALNAAELQRADCVVVLTDHSCIDYNFIVVHAQLVLDARNATKDVRQGREKINKI